MTAASIIIAERTPGDPLTTDCLDSLLHHHPDDTIQIIRVICPDARLYAAWNNATRSARHDTLVYLNNDTITSARWLHRIHRHTHEVPHPICGPAHRYDPILRRTRILQGWLLACHRALAHANPFDEQFHLYYGDLEWQLRLRSQNHALTELQLPVHHLHARTTRRLAEKTDIWLKDRQTFLDHTTYAAARTMD